MLWWRKNKNNKNILGQMSHELLWPTEQNPDVWLSLNQLHKKIRQRFQERNVIIWKKLYGCKKFSNFLWLITVHIAIKHQNNSHAVLKYLAAPTPNIRLGRKLIVCQCFRTCPFDGELCPWVCLVIILLHWTSKTKICHLDQMVFTN